MQSAPSGLLGTPQATAGVGRRGGRHAVRYSSDSDDRGKLGHPRGAGWRRSWRRGVGGLSRHAWPCWLGAGTTWRTGHKRMASHHTSRLVAFGARENLPSQVTSSLWNVGDQSSVYYTLRRCICLYLPTALRFNEECEDAAASTAHIWRPEVGSGATSSSVPPVSLAGLVHGRDALRRRAGGQVVCLPQHELAPPHDARLQDALCLLPYGVGAAGAQ